MSILRFARPSKKKQGNPSHAQMSNLKQAWRNLYPTQLPLEHLTTIFQQYDLQFGETVTSKILPKVRITLLSLQQSDSHLPFLSETFEFIVGENLPNSSIALVVISCATKLSTAVRFINNII